MIVRTVTEINFSINFHRSPSAYVELVSGTMNPLQTIAKVTDCYNGIFDTKDKDQNELDKATNNLDKTKLQTPYEMIYFVWLIEGVTRAFTHQLVRYRIGTSYAQESFRFLGLKNEYDVLLTVQKKYDERDFIDACVKSISTYHGLVTTGTSAEDARGVLPINTMTKIFFGVSLKTLQHIYEQRMCCQAQQGEWQPILKAMRFALHHEYGKQVSDLLSAPFERGELCGYQADFDRPCIWRTNDNS
jgi:flavin-dependent thymidylate synthase